MYEGIKFPLNSATHVHQDCLHNSCFSLTETLRTEGFNAKEFYGSRDEYMHCQQNWQLHYDNLLNYFPLWGLSDWKIRTRHFTSIYCYYIIYIVKERLNSVPNNTLIVYLFSMRPLLINYFVYFAEKMLI